MDYFLKRTPDRFTHPDIVFTKNSEMHTILKEPHYWLKVEKYFSEQKMNEQL